MGKGDNLLFRDKISYYFVVCFMSKPGVQIGVEIMFSYGLERKEAFEDDKSLNFLGPKNGYFRKGFTHGLGQKPSGRAVSSGLLLFIL